MSTELHAPRRSFDWGEPDVGHINADPDHCGSCLVRFVSKSIVKRKHANTLSSAARKQRQLGTVKAIQLNRGREY